MRFFAFQGIGFGNRPIAASGHPQSSAKWPWAIIQGPSGQLVQLNPPSGTDARFWTAPECAMNHSAVGWKHRHALFIWSSAPGTAGSMRCYSWNPQPQEASKINPNTNQFDNNENVKNQIIEDGYNWTKWNVFANRRDYAVMTSIHDCVFWVKVHDDQPASAFGTFKAHRPYKLSTSGYFNYHGGNYGNQETQGDAPWSRLPNSLAAGGAGVAAVQEGIDFRTSNGAYPTSFSHNPCEVVRHGDTFYVIWQGKVQGMTIGCKGNFVHNDYGVDSSIAAGEVSGYQQRNVNDVINATMRSACVHNDKVWMLTNEGMVYEIRPGGILERANLTTLGTPWASGIEGGQLNQSSNTTSFKPLIRSFNNQLHAFLNFRTSYKLAGGKGNWNSGAQGAGVGWFTSFDGINWQDRSAMLPASGIITPSGNTVFLETWKAQTHPYIHSAYMETNYPSGYGPSTNFILQTRPMSQGAEGQPSGYKQGGFLPFWSSGNLLDVPGTAYNVLKTTLSRGMLSGCLFPTFVSYPYSYAFVNPNGGDASGFFGPASGVWRPVRAYLGISASSGWDYTGCSNYHIGGVVDNDITGEPLLRLAFSRNYVETTITNNRQQPTLFYNLTKESGFIQVNEAWKAGQLCGFCPIELYDPEVILPSGDILTPNPYIDTMNKRVEVKFSVADWFFWETVKVKMEYSIDGEQSWWPCSTSGATTGLSTGTSLTDASGVGVAAAQKHTLYWLYDRDLSKNTFYPRTQIRIKAEVT